MNIILDFDSTIIQAEGLDILAEIVLKDSVEINKFKEFTYLGMSGMLSFEESLSTRIKMLDIDRKVIEYLVSILSTKISPSIDSLTQLMRGFPCSFYLVSGGFLEYVLPICLKIGFEASNIFANQFIFRENKVIGFDKTNLLAQKNGKANLIHSLLFDSPTIMVGDGYTDYQVRELGIVDKFVAYIESVERKNVVVNADYVCKDFKELSLIIQNYGN